MGVVLKARWRDLSTAAGGARRLEAAHGRGALRRARRGLPDDDVAAAEDVVERAALEIEGGPEEAHHEEADGDAVAERAEERARRADLAPLGIDDAHAEQALAGRPAEDRREEEVVAEGGEDHEDHHRRELAPVAEE